MPNLFGRKRDTLEAWARDLFEYGRTLDEAAIPVLLRRYQALRDQHSDDEWYALMKELSEAAERGETSVNVLNPFVVLEGDFRIASSAALDYALLFPFSPDDPLAGPRYVLDLARAAGEQERRLALLGGLVAVGNLRVTETLLDGSWEILDIQHQEMLAQRWNGIPWAGTIEFYLRWLESMEEENSIFGALAAVLNRIGRAARELGVVDASRRLLPGRHEVDSEILGRWTAEEYGRLIAGRLAAVDAREAPPKLLPEVMAAWGLEPPAPSGELVDYARRAREVRTGDHLSDRLEQCSALRTARQYTDLLAWGYFNPMGPTLVTLSLFPVPGTGDSLLGVLVDHFVRPEENVYGVLSVGDIEAGALPRAIEELFRSHGGGDDALLRNPPSHVYVPAGSPFTLEDAKPMFQAALGNVQPMLATAAAGMAINWLDPWERSKGELLGASDDLLGGQSLSDFLKSANAAEVLKARMEHWERPGSTAGSTFDYWWSMVTDPNHVAVEQSQFIYAWEGATSLVGDRLTAIPPTTRVEEMVSAAQSRLAARS